VIIIIIIRTREKSYLTFGATKHAKHGLLCFLPSLVAQRTHNVIFPFLTKENDWVSWVLDDIENFLLPSA